MASKLGSLDTQLDVPAPVATRMSAAGVIKIPGLLLLVLVGALFAGGAHATWFTVAGDGSRPDDDTVEVEVDTLSPFAENRTLLIRVNRSTDRTSWDGVAYRSYTAQVIFECSKPAAYYQSITFFKQPLWLGPPLTVVYDQEPRRELEFLSMQPNPAATLVRAAVTADAGQRCQRQLAASYIKPRPAHTQCVDCAFKTLMEVFKLLVALSWNTKMHTVEID